MWNPDSDESNSSSGSGDEAANEDSRDPFEKTPAEESKDEETKEEDDDEEDESDGKGEADSDYEDDDKPEASVKESDGSEDEDEKDSEDEDSEESEDSDDSGPKRKKARKTTSRKIDDKTRKLLEEENYLRRSGRQRSETKQTKSEARSTSKRINNRKRRIASDESDEGSSSSDWSDEPRKSKKTPKKKATPAQKGKKHPVYTSGGRKRIDYKEDSSDDGVNEEDVLEWKEDEPEVHEKSAVSNGSQGGGDTVEKVLKFRLGSLGATGPSTTCYNVDEKGDPNTGEAAERQFLVKWLGWSHLHNTWESDASLATAGAKGEKKIANFMKKKREIDEWRRYADKEYMEYYDCEQAMAEELLEEYKKVERVVAHQVSRDKREDGSEQTEYLIKWTGLPYSDCTWEDRRLIPRPMIEGYEKRIENARLPSRHAQFWKGHPKFVKLEEMPDFLKRGGKQKLHDY